MNSLLYILLFCFLILFILYFKAIIGRLYSPYLGYFWRIKTKNKKKEDEKESQLQ